MDSLVNCETFVKPYHIDVLEEEGLCAIDIANSLDVDLKRVHEKLQRGKWQSGFVQSWREVAYTSSNISNNIPIETFALNTRAAKAFVARWGSPMGDSYLDFLFDCEHVALKKIPALRSELETKDKIITRLTQERDSAMLALPAPARKRRSDAGVILTYAFVPGIIPGDLVLQPIYKNRDEATEFDMDMHRFKHCAIKGPWLLRTASDILKKYNSDPDPLIQQALDIVRTQVGDLALPE